MHNCVSAQRDLFGAGPAQQEALSLQILKPEQTQGRKQLFLE